MDAKRREGIRYDSWSSMEKIWGDNHEGINGHRLCINHMIFEAIDLTEKAVAEEIKKWLLSQIDGEEGNLWIVTESSINEYFKKKFGGRVKR
jgi:hypothetical protein